MLCYVPRPSRSSILSHISTDGGGLRAGVLFGAVFQRFNGRGHVGGGAGLRGAVPGVPGEGAGAPPAAKRRRVRGSSLRRDRPPALPVRSPTPTAHVLCTSSNRTSALPYPTAYAPFAIAVLSERRSPSIHPYGTRVVSMSSSRTSAPPPTVRVVCILWRCAKLACYNGGSERVPMAVGAGSRARGARSRGRGSWSRWRYLQPATTLARVFFFFVHLSVVSVVGGRAVLLWSKTRRYGHG